MGNESWGDASWAAGCVALERDVHCRKMWQQQQEGATQASGGQDTKNPQHVCGSNPETACPEGDLPTWGTNPPSRRSLLRRHHRPLKRKILHPPIKLYISFQPYIRKLQPRAPSPGQALCDLETQILAAICTLRPSATRKIFDDEY